MKPVNLTPYLLCAQGYMLGVFMLETTNYPPQIVEGELEKAAHAAGFPPSRGEEELYAIPVPITATVPPRPVVYVITDFQATTWAGGVVGVKVEVHRLDSPGLSRWTQHWCMFDAEYERLEAFAVKYRQGFTAKDAGL